MLLVLASHVAASAHCMFDNLRGHPRHIAEFKRCVYESAEINQISPSLLVVIKRTESGLKVTPDIINVNTDGSEDIGVMQINYPVWKTELQRLKNIDLARNDLLDICNNVHISAMIFKHHLKRKGQLIEAVGWYHSGTPNLKEKYQERFIEQARAVIQQCD